MILWSMAQRVSSVGIYLLPCEILFKMLIYEGQGISCSSGLQGRTALSSKEVLAEKATGWGNCSIHHIADIPKKYSKHGFWLGGHMQIPRDGKKREKWHLDTTPVGMF